MTPRGPSAAELAAARDRTVPDLIRPGLKVLFCGINPGLYSAALGQHFARPGNRFWPVLHAAGFTPRPFDPAEGDAFLALGYGIVNIADRATATADQLAAEELIAGARLLEAKVRHHRPGMLAVLGITAYRTAFGRKRAALGLQAETVGDAPVWVLPNPSGLNAHYQAAGLAQLFEELRRAVESNG